MFGLGTFKVFQKCLKAARTPILSLHCCILPVIQCYNFGVSCCSLAPNLSSCQRLRMCMEKVDEKAPDYIKMAESLK